MVKMLSIVATITLIAYLPYNLWTITYDIEDPLDAVENGPFYCDIILFAIQLTNGFTSPIVYLVFDRYFKVSSISIRVKQFWYSVLNYFCGCGGRSVVKSRLVVLHT